MAIQLHGEHGVARAGIREQAKAREQQKKLAIARMIVGPITNALSQFGAQAAAKYLPPSEWEEMKAGEPLGAYSPGTHVPDTEALKPSMEATRTEVQPTPAAALLRPPTPMPGDPEAAITGTRGRDVLIQSPAAEPVPVFPDRGVRMPPSKPGFKMPSKPGLEMPPAPALAPESPPWHSPFTPRRRHAVPEAVREAGLKADIPADRQRPRLPEGVVMERQRQVPTELAKKLQDMTPEEAAKFMSGTMPREASPFYKVAEGREGHARRVKAVREGLAHKRGLEKSQVQIRQQTLLEKIQNNADLRGEAKLKIEQAGKTMAGNSNPYRLGGGGVPKNGEGGVWHMPISMARAMNRKFIKPSPLAQAELDNGIDITVDSQYTDADNLYIRRMASQASRDRRAAGKRAEEKYKANSYRLAPGTPPIWEEGISVFLYSPDGADLSNADKTALMGATNPQSGQRQRRLAFNGVSGAARTKMAAWQNKVGAETITAQVVARGVGKQGETFRKERNAQIESLNDYLEKQRAEVDKRTSFRIKAMTAKDWAKIPADSKPRGQATAEAYWEYVAKPKAKKEVERRIRVFNKGKTGHRIKSTDIFGAKAKKITPGGPRGSGPPRITGDQAKAPTRKATAIAKLERGANKIRASGKPASVKRRETIDLARQLGLV